MKLVSFLLAVFSLVAALAVPLAAHEGHDHDKPPPLALPIAPRVTAVTPDFELVGVLSRKSRLTLFLTSFASNEPIKDAKVGVEAGDHKIDAVAKGNGVFEVSAPWLAGEGGLNLVFMLTLPDGGDLLTGRLERPVAEAAAVPAGSEPAGLLTRLLRGAQANPFALLLGIGGLVLGSVFTRLIASRGKENSSIDAGAAAIGNSAATVTPPPPRTKDGIKIVPRTALAVLLAMALIGPNPSVRAADMTPNATPVPPQPALPSTMATDQAQRLADGTVFVPKATQHLLSVRTILVAEGNASLSIELPGVVIAGPNNFGRVQAAHSGRLAAPPEGLAYLGKRVEKGDVLGTLEPHIGTVERGTIESQVAEADARIEAQKVKLARLRGAPLAIPPIKVEETEGELKALQERRRQLNPTLTERNEIHAPISGVVSKAGFYAGQIIDPRDVLFEIVDPSELWVEGIVYGDTSVDAEGEARAIVGPDHTLGLHYIGRGLTLKEQAATLMFRITGSTDGLSIGQPVRVVLKTTKKVKGLVVPTASLVRGQSGLPIVWVKTDAERFEPQIVKTEPLDGRTVVVTGGLKPDTRVVTEGVTLLNQVR